MKLIEKLVIIFSISIIVLGLVFDYTRFALFELENYDGFVLAVLQIQATLSTLSLSLLTIISSAFKRVEYGISVSDFIMNRSNKILSQKKVVIISLLLILASLFEYVRGHLNVVCSTLVVEVGLIVYMLHNVTKVLLADSEISEGIFRQEVFNPNKDNGIECFFNAFIKADDIPESKTKDYVEKAKLLIDSYLADKEKFNSIADGVSRMVSKTLDSNNERIADLGVCLLLHYYMKYRDLKLIESDDYLYGVFASSIRSIANGYKHTTESLNLYKRIPFSIIGNQIQEGNTGIDVRDAIAIAGYYAWNCCREGDEYLKQQISFFVPDITDRIHLGLRDDEAKEQSKLIEKAAADYYLGFANELMKAGKARILGDYCFRHTFSALMRKDNICRYYVLGIVILCLYYSVFEEDELVANTVKESCSDLLSMHWNDIRSYLVSCIYNGGLKADDLIVIRELLHEKELLQEGKAKFMIMNGVVNESMIILYALCDSSNIGNLGEFIEDLFSKDGDYNYRRLVEYPEKVRLLTGRILEVLYGNSNSLDEERKNSEVSRVYSVIEGAIKRELFKSIMDNSKRTLESVGSFETVRNRICSGFEKHVNETTSQFISVLDGESQALSREIIIPSISIPVGALNQEDMLVYLYEYIDDSICYGLLNSLKSHLEESVVNSRNESEVEEFIETVSGYDSVIGRGSSFVHNYILQKKIDDTIESRKNYIISDNGFILALFNSNAVSIVFSDYSATIQEFTEEEIKEKEEKKGNQYYVNVINDIILPFDEDALLEYYHNNKRKLVLKCNVTVRYVTDVFGKLVRMIES